jgi:hypothetical protein
LPEPSDVIGLVGSGYSSAFVETIIADAAIIAARCLDGVDCATQKAALKWLAAHLIASTADGGVATSAKLGDAQDSYARAVMGNGIMGTTYGQQAIAILPCLGRAGRPQARITVT